jgi:hypothetical protein
VLFIVDNSSGMAEEQADLVTSFSAILGVLDGLPGGRPNLHVGVISSTVSVGPYSVPTCGGPGDDGQLQNTARGVCTPPDDRYISDVLAAGGVSRETNYPGTLTDAFACIAPLGTAGCGFEQPLASLRLALDGHDATNAGFLRPGAALLVVLVTDEDDCSASDTATFDPGNTSLGSLSFRCTELGLQCASGPISHDSAGQYFDCEPRSGSYLTHPQEVADFLKALKADPRRVGVGVVIAPDLGSITVTLPSPGQPRLEPGCTGALGPAAPAVRLHWFAEQFEHNGVYTICGNTQDGYVQIANLAAAIMGL